LNVVKSSVDRANAQAQPVYRGWRSLRRKAERKSKHFQAA